MNFNITNFLPGWKRPLTLVLTVVIFAWHEAAAAQYIPDVPDLVYVGLGLFGFNALAHGQKNDAKP